MGLCAASAEAGSWTPNAQEAAIADLMVHASGQRRPFMVLDPILSKVARERAADMAQRGYFDHINPDGHGANYLVRKAGYVLPPNYPSDGNNLESIAGGSPTASAAWDDWMHSPDHKTHLLGEQSFFAAQTSYGVGYYADPASEYRYYWVVITAPPMPSPPIVVIAAPAEGAAIPEGTATISGSTRGNQPASVVQVRVENAAGVTAYRNVRGTQSWSGPLEGLAPGANRVRVRSLAANGTLLAEVARSVRYVVMRPLNVQVEGAGSVGGFVGSTSREVGRAYRITATPAAGWLFGGWSGSWGGRNPSVVFTMRPLLDVTARFIPNPFFNLNGTYSGLVAGTRPRGVLRVQMTRLGRFSGLFVLGSASYPINGGFDLAGHAVVRIVRPAASTLTLGLDLDLANADGRVAMSLLEGNAATELTLTRNAAGSPSAGQYTLTLAHDPAATNPAIPAIDGAAALDVDATGRAILRGRLADGVAFTAAGYLASDGSVVFYRRIYQGRGMVAGTFTITTDLAGTVGGSLYWQHPAQPAGTAFPRAFVTTLTVSGSRDAASGL
jgi:hypothetical protein